MRNVRQLEKWKNGLLIGLVLISMIQVGIHWNRQIQVRPFRLFASWIRTGNQQVVDERLLAMRKASYVSPVRISVSDELSTRWQIEPTAETWRMAWMDLQQQYFPLMAQAKPDKEHAREFWEQMLFSRRMMLFEFATPVPMSLFSWVSDASGTRKGLLTEPLPPIEQIAIVPTENINATINTLYVLAGDRVYRFSLNVPADALAKNWYVMDQTTLDEGNNRQMALIAGKYGLSTVRRGMLVLDDEIPLQLSSYEAVLPAAIPEVFSPETLQPLQESILLSRKDSLLTRLDEQTGEVTFSDMENVFRINGQGLLTYRYMSQPAEAAADMTAAFRQAVVFLDERRRLLGDAELLLTEVVPLESPAGAYVFHFSYRVDGRLVTALDADGQSRPPVSVTAVNTRVLACDWSIRSFSPVSSDGWNVFFIDLYNELLGLYPDLTQEESALSFVRTGYRFRMDLIGDQMSPQWQFHTETDIRFLPMRKEAA